MHGIELLLTVSAKHNIQGPEKSKLARHGIVYMLTDYWHVCQMDQLRFPWQTETLDSASQLTNRPCTAIDRGALTGALDNTQYMVQLASF
jgi:hypothetical protein